MLHSSIKKTVPFYVYITVLAKVPVLRPDVLVEKTVKIKLGCMVITVTIIMSALPCIPGCSFPQFEAEQVVAEVSTSMEEPVGCLFSNNPLTITNTITSQTTEARYRIYFTSLWKLLYNMVSYDVHPCLATLVHRSRIANCDWWWNNRAM